MCRNSVQSKNVAIAATKLYFLIKIGLTFSEIPLTNISQINITTLNSIKS